MPGPPIGVTDAVYKVRTCDHTVDETTCGNTATFRNQYCIFEVA